MNKLFVILLLAAVELLPPNGDVTNEWTGTYTDINEGTATPNDTDFITTGTEDDIYRASLTDSVITDDDTVTAVKVIVRSKDNDTTNRLGVNIYIAGVAKGLILLNTTSTITTYTVTNPLWDVDWTAAQLDDMDLYLTATRGGGGSVGSWWVYTVDVEVTYTSSSGGSNTVLMIL